VDRVPAATAAAPSDKTTNSPTILQLLGTRLLPLAFNVKSTTFWAS